MEGQSTYPRPVDGSLGTEMSTANTLERRENGALVDASARRESGAPVDTSAQRVPRASDGNVFLTNNPPVIQIPQGIPARETRPNPERTDQQLLPPEVTRQLQFSPQRPHNIFDNQGRRTPPANEFHLRSPLPEARQRQFPSARNLLQPRSPRAEINPNMAQVAQTFIPIIESILTLSQTIVWILSLFFFFMVLVLITSRIVRFFFPLDTTIDSPRLLFRLSSSGYSNAATIYEMVFPLSVSNPFLFIVIILGGIVVTRIIAYCVKVCSISPRC